MGVEQNKALVPQDQSALVPSNPRIQAIALGLKWKPETAIARIKRALPAPVEQQIYLTVANDFKILPETLARLLRIYLGHAELVVDDLVAAPVGKNLAYSKFQSFAEFLQGVLNLLKVVYQESHAFGLSIHDAALIVLHYGADNAEAFIEMVDTNLDELCEVFNVVHGSYSQRMRTCMCLMATQVIPENRKRGRMDILDPSDFIDFRKNEVNELRRSIGEERDEELHHDASDFLKKWGIQS